MEPRRRGQMRRVTEGVFAEVTYSYDKLRIFLWDEKRRRIPVKGINIRGEVHYPKELHHDPIKITWEPRGDRWRGRIGIRDDVKRFTLKIELDIKGETFETEYILNHPPQRRIRTPKHLRQPADYRY